MTSAMRRQRRERSQVLILRIVSRARFAAPIARSASSRSPSARWAMISPVAGLKAGKVLPDPLSTHCPPMKCLRHGMLRPAPAGSEAATVDLGADIDDRLHGCLEDPFAQLGGGECRVADDPRGRVLLEWLIERDAVRREHLHVVVGARGRPASVFWMKCTWEITCKLQRL